MDAAFSPSNENTLLDVIEDNGLEKTDQILINESLKKELNRVLKTIKKRDSDIIKMHFGIDHKTMSLQEIADELGMTRERIRQIRDVSLKSLRTGNKNNLLKTFL